MSAKPKEVSFYIAAHADDWQLFMNPNVFLDLINPENKVVIIITTAGDAGKTSAYWTAREEGCKSSVRFCIAPHSCIKECTGIREINQHFIHYWSANNVTCYFLRLPDGNMDGNGYSRNYYQSLSRLKCVGDLTITALDHSSIYYTWTDFYSTLNEIIDHESKGSDNIWVNYLNPDVGAVSYDHPDHQATGYAVQAMKNLPGVRQALFSGYGCQSPENIPSTDLFWKIGMLAAYEKAVFDISGYSTLKEDISQYRQWCFRNAEFTTIKQQILSNFQMAINSDYVALPVPGMLNTSGDGIKRNFG